jgi:uncharacterized membrane protein YraQ (UPF0718 family)
MENSFFKFFNKLTYFLVIGILISGPFLFFEEVNALRMISGEEKSEQNTQEEIKKETIEQKVFEKPEEQTTSTILPLQSKEVSFFVKNREIIILLVVTTILIGIVIGIFIYFFGKK